MIAVADDGDGGQSTVVVCGICHGERRQRDVRGNVYWCPNCGGTGTEGAYERITKRRDAAGTIDINLIETTRELRGGPGQDWLDTLYGSFPLHPSPKLMGYIT